MTHVLKLDTSINGPQSQSSQLAQFLIESLQSQHANISVNHVDLHAKPLPHLDNQLFAAFSADERNLSTAQAQALARSDKAISEVKEADYLVISAPMYNFGVPSTLKAWMDHIARAGVSFNYTSEGPKGLLGEKTVFVITTRGGQYKDSGKDFQVPFIKQFFNFVGFNDVRIIYAEGLAQSNVREASIEQAHSAIKSAIQA